MGKMANNSKEEPKTAPQPDCWYNLTLGSSFKDESSNKYCTLRYEFKPASIDKTKPGSLRKSKENRVNIEFQNNQIGKPKLTFEGSSEDYKDNDAVLFFDGETFRLERLHRSVKQIRLLRQPGESSAAAAVASSAAPSGPVAETRLSPIGKAGKPVHARSTSSLAAVPVEVEKIDIGESENRGAKSSNKGIPDNTSDPPNVSAASPEIKNEEVEEHQDIDIEDIFGAVSPENGDAAENKVDNGFDINIPQHNGTDDEIADVDVSDDDVDKGPNAAEALRAQVNAEETSEQTSSSSSSSGSGSRSGSGSSSGSSSSSSSDSEGSDEDSVNSI